MKKHFIIILLSGLVVVSACKGKKKDTDETTPSTTQTGSDTKSDDASSSETKTYTVVATPDSVSLGKDKEAFIRLKDLKAVALSNPDGQATGIELTYKIELTNRNAIGGHSVGVNTGDFRLELDNGTKINPSSTYVSAQPDATSLSDEDKFTIPPGAKPKMLHLFFDETKASIKLELQ